MNFYNSSDKETKELLPGINARTFWGDRIMLAVVDLMPIRCYPLTTIPMSKPDMFLKAN